MAPLTEGRKKGKIPTFQHLPVDRARKLKKQWLEKEKIKSSWRAQKRREGLVAGDKEHSAASVEPDDVADDAEGDRKDDEPVVESGEQPPIQLSPEDNFDMDNKPAVIEGRRPDVDHMHKDRRKQRGDKPTINFKEGKPNRKNGRKQQKAEDTRKGQVKINAPEEPSLRDLFQKAYSRDSLHTYKSDPLHRRRGAPSASAGKESSSQRAFNGQRQGTKGRGGQPNMKLRMEAMLAKIKRDYTT